MYIKEFFDGWLTNNRKGILTREEAQKFIEKNGHIFHVVDVNTLINFYTDSYTFGFNVLPKSFVPSTTFLPLTVTARDCVKQGIINTEEQFYAVFVYQETFVQSLDELLEKLNS